MFDITSIVKIVFMLVGAIITCVVVPYVRSKTTKEQQAELNGWIAIAVSAAEQIYKGSGRGAEKKQYVVEWLKAHGMKIDGTTIDAMIEAAVYNLKKGFIVVEEASE